MFRSCTIPDALLRSSTLIASTSAFRFSIWLYTPASSPSCLRQKVHQNAR